MRIRKRQPLFPLPSFSPLPLSDPHLINPSPVVQLDDIPPLHLDHHPPLPPIANLPNASDHSPGDPHLHHHHHHHHSKLYGLEQDGRGRPERKDNDLRKGSILGSETVADLVLSPSSSSPSNQDARWCEGEKAIPLKKRRGRLERIKVEKEEEEEVETSQNNNKKAKTRMKTKMNKKCSRTQNDNDQDYEDEDDEDKDEEEEKKGEGNVGRKRGRGRGRGSAVMEGSRCSRVNGRGWRCCQQTLVGYSLCEHHLGKGRLRSITSVKTRSLPTNHIAPPPPPPPSLFSGAVSTSSSSPDHQKQTQFDHALANKGEDHKEAAVIITKKRMKLGVVKARSISSLLGQTTTQVAVAPHNDNK